MESSVFYEFDDRYISFLGVLDLPSSSVIKTPWGIVSVPEKSMSFYLKWQFCLGLKLNT